jgi:hypothetical protein
MDSIRAICDSLQNLLLAKNRVYFLVIGAGCCSTKITPSAAGFQPLSIVVRRCIEFHPDRQHLILLIESVQTRSIVLFDRISRSISVCVRPLIRQLNPVHLAKYHNPTSSLNSILPQLDQPTTSDSLINPQL